MILPRYRIADSAIPGAGKGLFVDEFVAAGQIVTAPDGIDATYSWQDITSSPELSANLFAVARWFGDRYTVTPEWPDECYVNHAFAPNGVWHLGFIFAARDLAAGEELTIDYRHLLGEGQEEAFRDSLSGERIVGLSWAESLRITTEQLREALA